MAIKRRMHDDYDNDSSLRNDLCESRVATVINTCGKYVVR